MSSNEVWATCRDCATELKQTDKQCPKCGSTEKLHELQLADKISVSDSMKLVQKRKGYKEFMVKMISRLKHSGDPKLKGCVGEEVKEEMVFDKEKDWYDQVVKDAKTGDIIHEEHEPLSEHNKKEVK